MIQLIRDALDSEIQFLCVGRVCTVCAVALRYSAVLYCTLSPINRHVQHSELQRTCTFFKRLKHTTAVRTRATYSTRGATKQNFGTQYVLVRTPSITSSITNTNENQRTRNRQNTKQKPRRQKDF